MERRGIRGKGNDMLQRNMTENLEKYKLGYGGLEPYPYVPLFSNRIIGGGGKHFTNIPSFWDFL